VPYRTERQKLKGIRKGQRQAYEVVVCQHHKSIYRFMAYLTADVSLAEDLTQEVFICVWASIDGFKGHASLATWLHRIAYNKFVDSKRKLERDAALMTKLKQHSYDAREKSNPLDRIADDEHSRLLYEAIRTLESSEYIVIVLHYIQGLSLREMAGVLDESVGTVKWRTNQALKRLKSFLIGRV